MWLAPVFEAIGSLSHTTLCPQAPWALILLLCWTAFTAGAVVGCGCTLVCTSTACRRILWFGFQGAVLGSWPRREGEAAQVPARHRLREYRA